MGEGARLLLTRDGTVAKQLQERATWEENPFPLKSNTPYNLTDKHSVSLALTYADARTPTKLVCCPQGQLVALGPCSRRQLIRTLARNIRGVVAEMRQIHTDYRVQWRKREGRATFSREEHPSSFLDRLLLLFWAHYIEDGPHLPCTGLL